MTEIRHREPDEIDLLNLVERSISFFRRYRWLFIIALILGLLFGFLFYRAIPTTYRSSMLVHTSILTNQEEIQIIRNWNELLNKGEHEILGKILNTDPSILSKVKKIRGEEIQQVFSPVNPHGFKIEALVTDTSILDELQDGLVYGFDNSSYVAERLQMNRLALQDLITKAETESRKLDSTRTTIENIMRGRGSASSPIIIEGSDIHLQLLELNEKLVGFKRELEFTRAVQVLHGFQKFSQPAGPRLFPWLVIGLVVFLALAYVVALFSSVNRSLKQRAAFRKQQL